MPVTVGSYGPTFDENRQIAEILARNPHYKGMYKTFMNEDTGVQGTSSSLDMRMSQIGTPPQRFLQWAREQDMSAPQGLRGAYRRAR